MDDETRELWAKIKQARVHLRGVQEYRARLTNLLTGNPGMTTVEVEFPQPDKAEVYQCMFGRRVSQKPMVIYRLSFKPVFKWVGLSHAWGLKAKDIIIDNKG